ncbi:MAG: hypothetical protein LQ340_004793 [Diploschistes diacapsis]|nr:MAG: hypothetical protein LQ340_004793 [Diploschistes diacapsis]
MPSAFAISVIYAILSVVIAGAWVAGYLDKYQKMLQDTLLGTMGDNRMSYGLKNTIKSQEVGDENFQNLQNSVADTAGGLVGKGGVGEGIGNAVSQAL